MGKDELKVIAAELVTQVRKSVTIDWTLRESARPQSFGQTHPRKTRLPSRPSRRSTKLVLAQAELFCAEWAA
jgi:type I restriction enzyme R subunit